MRHYAITIRCTDAGPTHLATPAESEWEALADAINALDPWGDREVEAMRTAFSPDYVDTATYESEA